MASAKLGQDVIDVHTGGEDLIFPHHECEIAQSCGCSGESHFANYWVHARFLFVEGEKMSKSKGNFYTARDVFEGKVTGKPVHPAMFKSSANALANSLSTGWLRSTSAILPPDFDSKS